MREIRLFLYFLVGILLSANALISYATECDPTGTAWRTSAGGNYYGSSKAEACAKMASALGVNYHMATSYGEDICTYNNQGWSFNQIPICSDGKLPNSAGKCDCPDPCSSKAGWYDNGGNPQMVSLPGSSWYEGKGSGVPQTMCIDGCTADMKQNLNTQVTGGGYWGAETNPVYSGQSCSSNPNGTNGTTDKRMPKDSDEKKCVDSGKAFGYVNDKVVCVTPDSKGGTATKKTETNNADGTTTKTETTTNISCNAQGACSTTTTTTTTVINSDGTTASTKTETKKEDTGGGSGTGTAETSSFCKENPSSPMCKSGTFSGTCAQEPECTGDPVQCATAKAAFKTKCALEASSEVAAKGQALMDGTDQEVKDALTRKEISVAQITTSDTGGGSCPADRAVSVGDRVVMIPYSSVCGGMAMMKIAMLAIASFIAAMILIGGVK